MRSRVKVLIKNLVTLGAILTLTACSRDTLEDIPLFEQYIKENINKSSDDPYISSTVKPGEPMYEYLYKFQQGRGYLSMIEPLIEQGNTDAMVFKGRIYAKYIEGRGETIALLGRAMAAGDPFAALALSDGGEECRDFGKSSISTQFANAIGEQLPENIETCSAENWFKAQDGFKKLAEQGDLAAQYYLLRRQRIDNPDNSREAHEFYIKEIIRFAEGHYYRPLMDYVDEIWEINREEKNIKLRF